MERLPYKMNVNAPSFPPQAGALSHNHAQERLPSCPFPASFYHPSVCCACAPQPPPLKTLRLSRGGMNWQAALAVITLQKASLRYAFCASICRSRGSCGKACCPCYKFLPQGRVSRKWNFALGQKNVLLMTFFQFAHTLKAHRAYPHNVRAHPSAAGLNLPTPRLMGKE